MAQVNDRRRSRWIAWDVHFLDGAVGSAVFERFGFAGVALFVGFLSACKRNSVQGQMAYGSDADALAQMGFHGAELLDAHGKPFTLNDYWTLLGRLKQTSRRRRGHLTYVFSTRWERWQNNYGTRSEPEQKPRSDPKITDEKDENASRLLALDRDSDKDPDPDAYFLTSSSEEPLSRRGESDDDGGSSTPVIDEACALVGAERLNRRVCDLGPVGDPDAWASEAGRRAYLEVCDAFAALGADATADELASWVLVREPVTQRRGSDG